MNILESIADINHFTIHNQIISRCPSHRIPMNHYCIRGRFKANIGRNPQCCDCRYFITPRTDSSLATGPDPIFVLCERQEIRVDKDKLKTSANHRSVHLNIVALGPYDRIPSKSNR
ncbi:hypothetical protein D1872_217090 [compost metagenome]